MLTLDIQRAAGSEHFTPSDEQLTQWVTRCLNEDEFELCIRIVDNDEMIELNSQYRQQHKTTNVLSFPTDFPEELNIPLLGDIVICAEVVNQEAQEQGKTAEAHWAHITLHGTLHLLGYDHIDENDAIEMETLETSLMQALHYPAPYSTEDK